MWLCAVTGGGLLRDRKEEVGLNGVTIFDWHALVYYCGNEG